MSYILTKNIQIKPQSELDRLKNLIFNLIRFGSEGKALQWHQTFMKNGLSREWPSWGEYVRCLYSRFSTELFDDPMEDFKDLRQVSSVQDYVDTFDELLTRVELAYEYVVSCFISGLKPEIGLPVKMFAPRSLQRAISLARIQEQTISLNQHSAKNLTTSSYTSTFTPKNNYRPPSFSQPQPKVPPPSTKNFKSRFLTPKEMEERRSKGLCFNCDEKFSPGHVCKNKRQLFSLELEEYVGPEEQGEECLLDSAEMFAMMPQGLATDAEGSIMPHVSVHAMNGTYDFRTMRVTTTIKGKVIQVLIDTGSTHNFLDHNTAVKLGCCLSDINPFVVSVADGNKLNRNHVCKGLTWKMQGVAFESNMLNLPIGGYNMVLGVQRSITLGDIIWNFKQLRMEFTLMGQRVLLKGIQPLAHKILSGPRQHCWTT